MSNYEDQPTQGSNQPPIRAPDVSNAFKEVIELGSLSEGKQVITGLKLGFFPFAGFCMDVKREHADVGQELLNEYQDWFKRAKEFVRVVVDEPGEMPAKKEEKKENKDED